MTDLVFTFLGCLGLPGSSIKIWIMMLMVKNIVLYTVLCGASVPGLVLVPDVSFHFLWNIQVAVMTYSKLKHDIFWAIWRSFGRSIHTLNIWRCGYYKVTDRAFFRIHGKHPICSKRATWHGNTSLHGSPKLLVAIILSAYSVAHSFMVTVYFSQFLISLSIQVMVER